jgi:hypothetical protein
MRRNGADRLESATSEDSLSAEAQTFGWNSGSARAALNHAPDTPDAPSGGAIEEELQTRELLTTSHDYILRVRQQHPKAWQPWVDEEDERLCREFGDGQSIQAMATTHGRTQGAIRARLVKHGLMDPDPAWLDRKQSVQ